MLRLLIDENFDQRILRGLRLEVPRIDYIVVQEEHRKKRLSRPVGPTYLSVILLDQFLMTLLPRPFKRNRRCRSYGPVIFIL